MRGNQRGLEVNQGGGIKALTFFNECIQVRKPLQDGNIRDDSRINHGLVEFGLKCLHDVRLAAELPEEIRQRCG